MTLKLLRESCRGRLAESVDACFRMHSGDVFRGRAIPGSDDVQHLIGRLTRCADDEDVAKALFILLIHVGEFLRKANAGCQSQCCFPGPLQQYIYSTLAVASLGV